MPRLLVSCLLTLTCAVPGFAEPAAQRSVTATIFDGTSLHLEAVSPANGGDTVQIHRSYANYFAQARTGAGFAASTAWMNLYEEAWYPGLVHASASYSDTIQLPEFTVTDDEPQFFSGSVMGYERFTGFQYSAAGFVSYGFAISSLDANGILIDFYNYLNGFGPIPQGGDGSFQIEIVSGGWLSLGFSATASTTYGNADLVLHGGIQWKGGGVNVGLGSINLVGESGFNYLNAAPDLTFPSSVDPVITGDLNGDGFVGQDDLSIILTYWGQAVTLGDLLAGDSSGDGFVGQDDLNDVLTGWGQGTPPPLTATVPEPGTLGLLYVLLGLAARSRRGSALV